MKPLALILCLLISGCASSQPWTKTDKTLYGAACTANVYDYYTTEKLIDEGRRIASPWPELLYFGDETPSDGLLAISKVAQLGILWMVVDKVAPPYRSLLLFLATGTWVFYGQGTER